MEKILASGIWNISNRIVDLRKLPNLGEKENVEESDFFIERT